MKRPGIADCYTDTKINVYRYKSSVQIDSINEVAFSVANDKF